MKWTLSTRQVITMLLYSSLFPLSLFFGEPFHSVSIIITLPFLPLAWVSGVNAVNYIGEGKIIYSMGAFTAIALQVWFVLLLRHSLINKIKPNKTIKRDAKKRRALS